MAPTSTAVTSLSITSSLASNSATLSAHTVLAAASHTRAPCIGCREPSTINNKAFFALFAILGVAMVIGGLWFFFWAKNGGFHWEETDWDDYKTAVLRRKGPDGKTLSSRSTAKSSNVGSEYEQRARFAARSVVTIDEKGRKGILGRRGIGKSHSCAYSDDFTNYVGEYRDDITLATREPRPRSRSPLTQGHCNSHRPDDIFQYRSERSAQVGGMNRRADGSNFDFSRHERTPKEPHSSPEAKSKRRIRAERAAQEESERMELKWRKEAERVAVLIAKERANRTYQARQVARSRSPSTGAQAPAPPAHSSPRRAPVGRPRAQLYADADSETTSDTYSMYRPRAQRHTATATASTIRPIRQSADRKTSSSMPGSWTT